MWSETQTPRRFVAFQISCNTALVICQNTGGLGLGKLRGVNFCCDLAGGWRGAKRQLEINVVVLDLERLFYIEKTFL